MDCGGQRPAVLERNCTGGSCPNVACLPSNNVIGSAKANWFARHGAEYGIETGPVSTDMRVSSAGSERWWKTSFSFIGALQGYRGRTGSGRSRFVAPKMVEVLLHDRGGGTTTGHGVFLDLGSRRAPSIGHPLPLVAVDEIPQLMQPWRPTIEELKEHPYFLVAVTDDGRDLECLSIDGQSHHYWSAFH